MVAVCQRPKPCAYHSPRSTPDASPCGCRREDRERLGRSLRGPRSTCAGSAQSTEGPDPPIPVVRYERAGEVCTFQTLMLLPPLVTTRSVEAQP
jgi:hypothetical protein